MSSLTRRVFPSEHNTPHPLHDQRLAAIVAANETNLTTISLNAANMKSVHTVGKEAAMTFNLDGTDKTYLSDWGDCGVWPRLTADLIIEKKPCLGRWLAPNEELRHALSLTRTARLIYDVVLRTQG
ncbi:hypothetical protein BJ170DRAFT_216269 [Xylariales sp. AK1849]|nr:hypothetical protein BJ170DRAFT_216269 [Xylariales sp. AK1849]